MSEVYGSSIQVQHCEGVPLQQKLLVCTLLLMVKTGKFKEVQLGKVGGLAGQGGWAGWARWVDWLGIVGGLVGQGGWAGSWFLCSFQSEHLQRSDSCVVRIKVVSQDAGCGLIAGPSQFLTDVAVLVFKYFTLLWNVDHRYAAFLLYF